LSPRLEITVRDVNAPGVGPRAAGRQGQVVIASAVTLLVVPIVADVIASGPARLFGYVASDTFYYLVVARHIGAGVVAFDGSHPSNGFHPLWQALVSIPYLLGLFNGPAIAELAFTLVLSLLCLSAAVLVLGLALRRDDGSLNPLFAALPVGAYALIISPAWLTLSPQMLREQNPGEGSEPLFGTLWSYVNGMESPLVLLAFALLFWAWRADLPRRRPAVFGSCLALLTLARLDQFFVAAAICAAIAWRERWWTSTASLRSGWILTSGFALPLLAYLVMNSFFFGSMVPVSGQLKSTFPWPTIQNARTALHVMSSLFGAPRPPIFDFWRIFQLAVPGMAALLAPLLLRRDRTFLLATSLGVLTLASYNFLFVQTYGQGHWYMPLGTLLVSLIALDLSDRWLADVRPTRVAAIVGVTMLIGGAFFLRLHRHTDYHARFSQFFFDEAPLVRARFAGHPPKLLEFDDGIVSWATGFDAMSAWGPGLDVEGALALNGGHLFDVADQRGFNHATSLVYFGAAGLSEASSQEEISMWSRRVPAVENLAGWRLNVTYRSKTTDFVIVEFGR
jgi:hypothetical protein